MNILKLNSVIPELLKTLFVLLLLTWTGCQKRTDPGPKMQIHNVSPATQNLHQVIAEGSFDELLELLKSDVDVNARGQLGQTALMIAIDAGNIEKLSLLLKHGADPELTSDFNTTALGCAVHNDFVPAIQLLLDFGVDRGYRPKYPQKHIDFGIAVGDMKMPESLSGIMSEDEWKSAMQEGSDLIESRKPPVFPVIRDVQSVEALRLFLAAGDPLGSAPTELKFQLLGLPSEAPFTAPKEDFLRDQTRRFGLKNPDPMSSPFWHDMIRNHSDGYKAKMHYLGNAFLNADSPVWSNQRFGSSLTALPDGRFVQIGGEHEDHYDPDFCIYNDVIVFDGTGDGIAPSATGGFQLYGYPRDVFPPTDFHSATLVGEYIYIIGSLGYMNERHFDNTPVYRLNTKSFAIEKVETVGENPGWIHEHLASFDAASNSIRLIYGNIQTDQSTIVENNATFVLNLESRSWSRTTK